MWSGPVGRSPVIIRKRAGSLVACSSMSASRTVLRSRAAAYVALSSCALACLEAVGVLATSVLVRVGLVRVRVGLVDMVSPVVVETHERDRPHPLSSGEMRGAARGRLRISGWFDGPPQLGSHHARIGATVELMSVRVRDEDALGDESHPAARAARGIVGDVGRARVGPVRIPAAVSPASAAEKRERVVHPMVAWNLR